MITVRSADDERDEGMQMRVTVMNKSKQVGNTTRIISWFLGSTVPERSVLAIAIRVA